jgi:hypothetical protein
MLARNYLKLPNQRRLLSFIAEEEIYSKYGAVITDQMVSSPFREDKNPSFNLFRNKADNALLFKDFTTGEVGNCFLFAKKMTGASSYPDLYTRITIDFGLQSEFQTNNSPMMLMTPPKLVKRAPQISVKEKLVVTVKQRLWAQRDADYWKRKYGLTRKQLEYCGVYPISHFFIGQSVTIADTLSYVYIERKDGKETYKVYQPFNNYGRKWINNNDNSVWELWSQMPDKGKKLIITSSRKDAMVVKSCFQSSVLTACSLQAESIIPKESVMNELKGRFPYISFLYDNDLTGTTNWGREFGEKLSNKFDIPQIEIPSLYKVKDISDFIEKYGFGPTHDVLIKLILEQNGTPKVHPLYKKITNK